MTTETTASDNINSGPLRHAELSEVRHNLRTPINHVLGYTEMLIEDATGAGRGGTVEQLRTIHSAGRAALAAVNETLGNREEVDRGQLTALCDKVRPAIDRIRTAVARIKAEELPAEWLPDLDRIDLAAGSIAGLLLGRSHDPAPVAPAPQISAAPSSAAARILVVDDNPTNRNMLSRRLQRQGYHVEEASDGGQALDRIATEPFDIVLLDIMMPVMGGFEVLARMKSNRRMRTTPVLVISALNEMESAIRAIQMGAEDYLLKPFDPVLLRARIGALVEKKRLIEELAVQQKLASLGALTAGIAHEIKNPLNFVVNFAELSTDLLAEARARIEEIGKAGPAGATALHELRDICADLENNIGKIREHGARADGIIASMLAHSRGQRGERRATDVNGLVREYVSLAFHGLRAQDRSFQASIQGDYDPAAGSIQAIPQDLSRVVLNVAGNAFYALRQKARQCGPGYEPVLRVTTCALAGGVEIRFHDNGTGIHKDALERVFDPFFTTKRAGEGTGLGLSISYEIVVGEHGGQMRVNSVEGEFTEFVITLPRDAPQDRHEP